jgi:hypothetical protein
MVRPERLELPTLCSEGRCSIQLSYGRGQRHSTAKIPARLSARPKDEFTKQVPLRAHAQIGMTL